MSARFRARRLILTTGVTAVRQWIAELPDNESATAIALTVNGSGGTNLKTTVLLTPEEVA